MQVSRVNGDLVLHSDSVMYRNAVDTGGRAPTKQADAVPMSTADDQVNSGIPAPTDTSTPSNDGSGGGLLGGAAQGLLDPIGQLAGVLKRDADIHSLGPVETRPRIGLVERPNLNSSVITSVTSSQSTIISSFFPAQDTTQKASFSSTALSTPYKIELQSNVLYIVAADTSAQHPLGGAPLAQFAVKPITKPVTFLGIMFGRAYQSLPYSIRLIIVHGRHVFRRQRSQLGIAKGPILLLQQGRFVDQLVKE